MESLVIPRGLYECTATVISQGELRRLSNAVLRGLLGPKRGRQCAEVVFTLFCPGHRIDPMQAEPYLVLTRLHRMISRREDLHHLYHMTWIWESGSTLGPHGPVGIVKQALAQIGAIWLSPFVIKFGSGLEVALKQISTGEWAHIVRDALQQEAWRSSP